MERKKVFITGLLAVVLMLSSVNSCLAQEKEMPITSESKEAIELFKEARHISENFEFTQALEKYDEVLALDSDFALAHLYKSRDARNYNQRMESLDEALKRIDEVSEGEKIFILFHKARYNSKESEMKKYLHELLSMYPNDKRVNLLAGSSYYFWENYDKALEYCHMALKIDESFPIAVNMTGYIYRASKKYDKAESYFQQYIELLPDKANPYDSYADFLLSRERYDESIKYYERALEKDKLFTVSLRRIGNIYILKEEYAKAREAFQKYYDESEGLDAKFGALYNIGLSYLYEGGKDKAINEFEKYKELAKENELVYNEVLAYTFQGYIQTCCNNPEKGLDFYDKAVQAIENSEISEEEKDELRFNTSVGKSLAFTELSDYEKSNQAINKCKKVAETFHNKNQQAWVSLITAYQEIKKNNTENAIEIINGIEISHPLKDYYLALAYEKGGDNKNAQKHYKAIINTNESGMHIAMYYKRVKEKF